MNLRFLTQLSQFEAIPLDYISINIIAYGW